MLKIFKITGLTKVFGIDQTVDQAIAATGSTGSGSSRGGTGIRSERGDGASEFLAGLVPRRDRHRNPVVIGRAAGFRSRAGRSPPGTRPATSPAARGISTYTDVSDQHSTFDTKVIVATWRKPLRRRRHLGNQTDLPVTEHATDIDGARLANFVPLIVSACSWLPASATWARSPCTGRGRGLTSQPATRPPGSCSPSAQRRASRTCGTTCRGSPVAASVKGGHAMAALVVGKLVLVSPAAARPRTAIKEYGRCAAPSTPPGTGLIAGAVAAADRDMFEHAEKANSVGGRPNAGRRAAQVQRGDLRDQPGLDAHDVERERAAIAVARRRR